MPSAQDAREWAASGGLRGIGDSLYTPFSGRDGDDIDWDAYRTLVRYCVGDLAHDMLWLTSGVGEWWSLTIDERKQLLEVAVEESRAIAPGTVIQACTAASSAKETVELTLHAQEHGADIAYIQTPPMEVARGRRCAALLPVRRRPHRHRARHVQLAVVGLRPDRRRDGGDPPPDPRGRRSAVGRRRPASPAPELVIWECDTSSTRQAGSRTEPSVLPELGTSVYLFESPIQRVHAVLAVDLGRQDRRGPSTPEAQRRYSVGELALAVPGRPESFTDWGEAFKRAAAVIGLLLGEVLPVSADRRGAERLPEEALPLIRAGVGWLGRRHRWPYGCTHRPVSWECTERMFGAALVNLR